MNFKENKKDYLAIAYLSGAIAYLAFALFSCGIMPAFN